MNSEKLDGDFGGKQSFIKKAMLTGQLNRFLIYLSAVIPAVVLLVLSLFAFLGVLKPIVFGDVVVGNPIDYIVVAVLVLTGVLGIYEFLRLRRVRKIDERFPDFVRDIAESRRAGMTFTKAIMNASNGNYGVLTSEIQKISQQISWGSSVDDALDSFALRVNTKLIRRTISLIIEASRSGGNVADVLEAASKDAREMKLIDSERRAGMLAYVAVVYVGMGVFLLITVILCTSFLPGIFGEGREGLSSAMGGGGGITKLMITEVFYYAALMQSAGMGLVTGCFEEGNMISGVKHTFIMILITFIVFKFIVAGL